MAKHNKRDKITQEQRKEIALLVNAGICQKLLAKDYELSIHTISAISRQRKKWIEEEQIATNKEQRFRYAQRIYPQVNHRLRKYVLDFVYESIITGIQERLVGESPERLFLKAVLGFRSLPKIDKKAVAEYRARIRKHALVLIDDGMKNQTIYDNLKQAAVGMGDLIAKREEANLRTKERRSKDDLRKGINQVLRSLKSKKRRIAKLRYGLSNGQIPGLVEIGRRFHITTERVRQIQGEVIKKLRDPEALGKLKKLVDSPAIRQFLQRPGFSRKKAKT